MKTKSPLLIAIGALALFVSVAFPSSTALADCFTVDDPYVYYEYGGPTGIQVEMEVAYPTSGAIIYFTTNGSNPTRDGSGNPGPYTSIYTGAIFVPNKQCIYIKAMAWKPGTPCWFDSGIVPFEVCNPVQ
jgi:hypothetical protein